MNVTFADDGWDDYLWWQENDKKILRRINTLITEIARHGNEGIGKPEPLRRNWDGWWSRRINAEHRLIYRIEPEKSTGYTVQIAKCRHHYSQ